MMATTDDGQTMMMARNGAQLMMRAEDRTPAGSATTLAEEEPLLACPTDLECPLPLPHISRLLFFLRVFFARRPSMYTTDLGISSDRAIRQS